MSTRNRPAHRNIINPFIADRLVFNLLINIYEPKFPRLNKEFSITTSCRNYLCTVLMQHLNTIFRERFFVGLLSHSVSLLIQYSEMSYNQFFHIFTTKTILAIATMPKPFTVNVSWK